MTVNPSGLRTHSESEMTRCRQRYNAQSGAAFWPFVKDAVLLVRAEDALAEIESADSLEGVKSVVAEYRRDVEVF